MILGEIDNANVGSTKVDEIRLGSKLVFPRRSVSGLAPNASMWGVRDLTGGTNPLAMRVQRSINGPGTEVRDFYANEIEDGTLLSWVTEGGATADGTVIRLYDQNASRGFTYWKDEDFNAPKIVVNGVLSRDSEGKVAINGNSAKLRMGPDNSHSNTNFFSSDGTWSLFLVTDFPNYSGATNTNVQIVNFETATTSSSSSKRKPAIACNKNFNQLAVSTPTQTVGSNTEGNIFLPTYPGEQLFSNFGNPASATGNNQGFLDGVSNVGDAGSASTNAATGINTNTTAPGPSNVLFQPTESGVTTFLSALVYSPSNLGDSRTDVENELIRVFNIDFVNE